jgi:hypothetical protein
MAQSATWRWPLLLILVSAISTISVAAQEVGQNFIDHLQRQIICQSRPDPTPTLFYLSRNKRIDAKKGQRISNESCWNIYPLLKIDGVSFSFICASSGDPLLAELFPTFYYQGTGTSPGTGLRLVTNDDENTVDDWLERAKARLGVKGETELDIGEPTLAKGKTEVSCNSTSFDEKK